MTKTTDDILREGAEASKDKLNLKLMGLAAFIGPFTRFNSSSRIQMASSHLSQALTPLEADVPMIMTGGESQLAEHSFKVKMPVDGIVHSVHKRFQGGQGLGAINSNPTTYVIYSELDTGRFSVIEVPTISSRHSSFGSFYKIHPMMRTLRKGAAIAAGTILAESAAVTSEGVFTNTISTPTIYISDPAAIEDGYKVSDEFCRRAQPLSVGSSETSWGRKRYPLNLYGDATTYKPFPDVGEKIRADGMVFATRDFDTMFDAVNMTPDMLMDIDMVSDHTVYGTPGAIVSDVIVYSGIGESKSATRTPEGMEVQAEKYRLGASNMFSSILESYEGIQRATSRGNVISPELQNLLTHAIADKPNSAAARGARKNGIIRRTIKGRPLDEYNVTIKYYKRKVVKNGAKITGFSGNKGVLCEIVPVDQMPIDAAGNRVHLMGYGRGVVSRLNMGQIYKHFMSAASRDHTKAVAAAVAGGATTEQAFDMFLEYYAVASPTQHRRMKTLYVTAEMRAIHVESILAVPPTAWNYGAPLYIEPTDEDLGPQTLLDITKIVKPTYGPIQYTNSSGKTVITKDNILVGNLDFMILEKTEQRPMAVSSATLQHHGLISGSSRESRTAHSSKQQSTKVISETEGRLLPGTIGKYAANSILVHANNPEAHRAVVSNIFGATKPSQVKEFIPEELMGGSRAVGFVTNVFGSAGFQITKNKGE